MSGNIIGTSSYSEAMDLSDLDDCGYDQQSTGSAESAHTLTTQAPVATAAQVSTNNEPQEPPVKIRKKPGRKPNPASPALRKAQNRAAQRAFRERKERHMKDLETNIRSIKDERDKLLQENATMSSENEVLKSENWYLKGIVLSLQLVCLQHKLVIPRHCPHLNDQSLSVLAQSIPKTISSYLNVNANSKHQLSQKLMDPTQQSHSSQQQQPSSYTQTHQSQQGLSSGSILITPDGVQTVQNKRSNSPSHPSGMSNHSDNSWYHQQSNTTSQPPAQSQSQSHYEGYYGSPNTSTGSVQDEFSNIPPLSPMSTSDREKMTGSSPQPVLLSNEPVTSNLAAIQTLRLRLRLQSACVRMQSMPFAIQPTLLQLSIPHDPRIDLIPTPHMRDRMILYRDQFDLDDCFRCLLGGSVFHGGDPAIAGNWQLPAEFFEKYWFLTIDYDIRRYTNEWRKKQGLEEINTNIPSINQGGESPITTTTTTTPPQSQQKQQAVYVNNPPPPSAIPQQVVNLSYEDLSGYLGVQLNKHQPQQKSQPSQQTNHITPIQLTNGYGIMGSSPDAAANSRNLMSAQVQAQQQPSPWQNLLMGSKNYDMMMSGLYSPTSGNNNNNNNKNMDMDQTSN